MEQIWIPFTQEYFVLCFVEIGQAVLKKILKIVNIFSVCSYCLPLEK